MVVSAVVLNPFVSSEVETRFAWEERPSTTLGTNGSFYD